MGGYFTPPKDFLRDLQRVAAERSAAWMQGQTPDPLFYAVELGGEVGEILNEVKKLVREDRGLVGSRTTMAKLEQELGDGLVTLVNLANHYGIDLAAATAQKFNDSSRKNGFEHTI